MATLKERLSDEMKSAMKAGDKDRLGFARNLHAAIRKKEIDDRQDLPQGLDDEGVIKMVTTLVKQRQESIDQFRKGGRDDLVAKEEAELKFLQEFLPPQLSEAEVRKLVEEAVAESGASSPKDMGKVMQVLMPKVQGRADGKMVSQLVRERLSSAS